MIKSRLSARFAFASFVLTLLASLSAGCGQDKSKGQIRYETARLERGAAALRLASDALPAPVEFSPVGTASAPKQLAGLRIAVAREDFLFVGCPI